MERVVDDPLLTERVALERLLVAGATLLTEEVLPDCVDTLRVELLPATLLCGSVVALVCNLICYLPGESGVIPLNAVTPLIGAPVIIYVIARKR